MPNCSKCKQPTKGHKGPYGANCLNVSFHSSQSNMSPKKLSKSERKRLARAQKMGDVDLSDDNPPETVQNHDPLVLELMNQVAKLSAKIESLPTVSSNTNHLHLDKSSDCDSDEGAGAVSSKPKLHIDEKSDSSVSLENGCIITAKKAQQAQAGEYANLNDFLPSTIISKQFVAELSEDGIKMKENKGRHHITDFFSWLVAFSGYMEIVLEKEPKYWKSLMKYRLTIMEFDARYQWASVYLYDLRYRAKKASAKSFDFYNIDTDIMLCTLTPDCLKENTRLCYRCKSPLHLAKKCPFLEECAMETPTQEAQSTLPRKPRWRYNPFTRSNETCNNWNRGRCHLGEGCPRIHRCESCGGKYPKQKCFICAPQTNWSNAVNVTQTQPNISPNAPPFSLHNFAPQSSNMGRPYVSTS